jgi:hypothetical protein
MWDGLYVNSRCDMMYWEGNVRRDGGSAVTLQEWIEREEGRKGDIVLRLY